MTETFIQNALAFNQKLPYKPNGFILYYYQMLVTKLSLLKCSFPKQTLHAVSVKSNPLTKILQLIVNQGCGLECASWGECLLALNAGAHPSNIVFDSPCKTGDELFQALEKGITVNCDSFDEWERITNLSNFNCTTSSFGLRINSCAGIGSIESTSVVGPYSKFGVSLHEHYDQIISLYLNHPKLTGIHVHTGSQGCGLDLLVRSVHDVYLLAETINSRSVTQIGVRQLTSFNIGGGLPVNYLSDECSVDVNEYSSLLAISCPNLFSEYNLVTEFGRFVHAKNAIACSRIEYVKQMNTPTIINHFGADLLLRACYAPNDWTHRFSVFSHDNSQFSRPNIKYTIAGPLCFSGDVIGRDVELPEVSENDYLIIHDVGAYTLSMWSMYNSRFFPLCLSVDLEGEINIIKHQFTTSDLLEFWS